MGMDIINIFNENMYNYATSEAVIENVDYTKYPKESVLRDYIKFYLFCFNNPKFIEGRVYSSDLEKSIKESSIYKKIRES